MHPSLLLMALCLVAADGDDQRSAEQRRVDEIEQQLLAEMDADARLVALRRFFVSLRTPAEKLAAIGLLDSRYTYLADLYPEAGITPAIGDPLRGPYLRWMFFYNASFEPALVDKSMKREPAPPSTSPYGDYETVMRTLSDQLGDGPYLLGERFTALDALWGTALRWTTMFKLVPETPAITAYIERVTTRPAALRAARIDADILAAREK